MRNHFKQCVGIDISSDTFTASVASFLKGDSLVISNTKDFKNTKTGFNQLTGWVKKFLVKDMPVLFLMEATGIYYESLAYHLNRINKDICVCLPNKAKYYAKSLNIKTKTDAVDAKMLARYGVEHEHELWAPPREFYRKLRSLTRMRHVLLEDKVVVLNRIHNYSRAESIDPLIDRMNSKLFKTLEAQITRCEEEIKNLIKSDEELNKKTKILTSIQGISDVTVAVVIAETHGFERIKSSKQLTSFAGLDVVENQSGSSIHGKTRISKKGNSYIRKALYMPAVCASRTNPILRENYHRIVDRSCVKKKGITALQRKLLVLMFTLWKKEEKFNPYYRREDNIKNRQPKGLPIQDKSNEEPSDLSLDCKDKKLDLIIN